MHPSSSLALFLRPRSSAYHQSLDLSSALVHRLGSRQVDRRKGSVLPESLTEVSVGPGRGRRTEFRKQRKSFVAGGVERNAKRRKCIREVEPTPDYPFSHTEHRRGHPSARLTLPLIRKFISYISPFETVHFSSSCKAFSKLLCDSHFEAAIKKELKSIFLYNDGTLRISDVWDIERMLELAIGGKRGKQFIFRAFLDICYIDASRGVFYYWESDSIVEGKFIMYNESVEIFRTRPALPNTLCFDISGEHVVCANDTCLGICYPNREIEYVIHKRRTVLELRFVGGKKMIALASEYRVDIYEFSLRLVCFTEFQGRVCQFFVPSATADVFAVTTDLNSIETYIITGSTILLNSRIANEKNVNVKELLYHEQDMKGYKVRFSIVLFETNRLYINQKAYGTCSEIKLRDGFLIKVSTSGIDILGVTPISDTFQLLKSYTVAADIRDWVTAEVWKTKVMLVTKTGLYWCRKGLGMKIFTVNEFKIPSLAAMEVRIFGEYVMIKGEDGEKGGVVTVFHFSVSDSMDIRASLTKK